MVRWQNLYKTSKEVITLIKLYTIFNRERKQAMGRPTKGHWFAGDLSFLKSVYKMNSL